MGVMIQDNLNLKGENSDLRERMLELEREINEQHRYLADYRERMETRVRVLEDAVSKLMASQRSPQQTQQYSQPPQQQYGPPPQANQQPYSGQQQQERRSFWSRLIGG